MLLSRGRLLIFIGCILLVFKFWIITKQRTYSMWMEQPLSLLAAETSCYHPCMEVFTFPGIIHMESTWNPWNPCGIPCEIHGINVGWDHSQFIVPWTSWIPYGMVMEWSWNGHGMVMEWSWNGHGMVNSIWNPSLFHMDSTGFHMECRHIHHGFHG